MGQSKLISQYDLCENKEAMTALLKGVNNLEVAANIDQSLKVSVIEVKEPNALQHLVVILF